MERRTIRGDRSVTPYWHQSQSLRIVKQQLFCPCGTLVYSGPKPTFARVSCPKCRQVMDVRRPDNPPKG
jgi:hypothetical protein